MVPQMFKSLTGCVSILALSCSMYSSADITQQDANQKGYNPAKGFHFYEKPPEPLVEEIAKKVVDKLIQTSSESEEKPGSSAWLKKHLPEVRQTAADEPTTENVRALLLMEKMLRDKGRRLARRAAMIAQTDPYLDTSYKPTSNIAMARDRRLEADNGKDKLVEKLVSDGVSLWVFVSGDCSGCERWIASMSSLTKKFGLKILWIIDPGTELPTPPKFTDDYWQYRESKGEAKGLGVKSDMSAFAYHDQKKQYVLVSQGFMPVSSFSHKLIISADYSGWVSPSEVESTIFRVSKNDLSEPDRAGFTGDYSNPVEYSNYIYEQLVKGQ